MLTGVNGRSKKEETSGKKYVKIKIKNGVKKMPWETASKIELSEKQKSILAQFEKGTHIPMHLKSRSQIILMANDGLSNNQIERVLHISADKVKVWRDRYSKNSVELNRIEEESSHKLRENITKVLSDAARSGAPTKFTDEQVAAIIVLSCEDPAKFNLPFSHWTPELLRIEAIKLDIVEDISIRQIGRFLKRKRFKAKSEQMLAQPQY